MERLAPLKRNDRCPRGQMLPVIGGGMVVLLGVLALSVDVGQWRYLQRREQAAADAAAIAGAIQTYYPASQSSQTNGLNFTGPIEIANAARAAATSNGFTDDNGAGKVTVTVNNPPSSGNYTSSSQAVEVIVKQSAPLFFAKLAGLTSDYVSARAVARAGVPADFCVMQMNPADEIGMVPPG